MSYKDGLQLSHEKTLKIAELKELDRIKSKALKECQLELGEQDCLIQRQKEENARLKRRLDMFESGSNKSALNIHKEGKKNLQRYIDTHHYRGMTTGTYFRNLVDRVEPYSYAQIIEGKF